MATPFNQSELSLLALRQWLGILVNPLPRSVDADDVRGVAEAALRIRTLVLLML